MGEVALLVWSSAMVLLLLMALRNRIRERRVNEFAEALGAYDYPPSLVRQMIDAQRQKNLVWSTMLHKELKRQPGFMRALTEAVKSNG